MNIKRFPTSIQLDAKDCGPACIQMICKYYDKYYDLEYLREITGTRKEGSSVYDLIVALEKVGLKSIPLKTSYKKLNSDIPLPCIVYWQGNHYVVVYKINDKFVYVSDPQLGLVKYTKKEFNKGWLGYIKERDSWKKGVCIAIEPISDFNKDGPSQAKPSYLAAFRFIWGFVKPYKKEVSQIILILIVLTFIGSLIPIITQTIIDTGISTRDIGFISLMIISMLVLNVSTSLGQWVQQSINVHFSSRIKVSMVSDYLTQLFKLPLSFFENRLMGDLLQRSYDYDRIESVVLYACFNTILGVMSLIVFGAILCFYNSTIFFVFLGFSILYILWTLLFLSIRKRMDIKYFNYIAANHSHWMELLSKILDIKSYGFGKNKRWQWEKVQVGLYKTKVKLLHVNQLESLGNSLINSVKSLTIIYIAAMSVINGDMTLGMLISVQYIIGQLNGPMDSIVQFITTAQLSYISYMRVSEINNAKIEEVEQPISSDLIHFGSDIRLSNVYYKYSINEDPVLSSLSFAMQANEFNAIVGASGSGKSTVIKLLMQLYKPVSGDIYLGEQNISSFSVEEWRKHCGVITQESTILKDTILNNITFGRPYDKDLVIKSVRISNVQSEIESLPRGYNTLLGENGRGLSEGQKQRILFARAVYNNPQYIFLDEVTSSLDSKNEAEILKSIKNELTDCTVVIAAHRLSSVIDASRIIVLDKGRVVEIGNHESLMKAKAYYYNLFITQTN